MCYYLIASKRSFALKTNRMNEYTEPKKKLSCYQKTISKWNYGLAKCVLVASLCLPFGSALLWPFTTNILGKTFT